MYWVCPWTEGFPTLNGSMHTPVYESLGPCLFGLFLVASFANEAIASEELANKPRFVPGVYACSFYGVLVFT